MDSSSSPPAALLAAEQTLFDSVGVAPTRMQVDLERIGSTVRLLEIGAGPPVLFVHGAMTGAASWVSLAAHLTDFRCLLLDRPGCGLSGPPDPLPRSPAEQERIAAALIIDVLDALELESVHVVSTSLGGWYAFRAAAQCPDRIGRLLGMGFQVGAHIDRAPLFIRLPPPLWLAGRLRVSRGLVRQMLRAAGMRHAVDSGGFSDEMLDWMVALLNTTDTMRNELVSAPRPIGLRGPVDAVRLPSDMARRLTMPVHLVWGTDDPFGGRHIAAEFASLLPNASLQMVDGAGHAPWVDEPELSVQAVRTHLDG